MQPQPVWPHPSPFPPKSHRRVTRAISILKESFMSYAIYAMPATMGLCTKLSARICCCRACRAASFFSLSSNPIISKQSIPSFCYNV